VSFPVIVREDAEDDILEAARWYEAREIGLGTDFIRCIDSCLMQISRNPEIAPVVYRGARMALPRRFPYLVIYKIFDTHISVVAVIRGSRHPGRWRARIRK
jgi:plasmid stabilization system protein ParE